MNCHTATSENIENSVKKQSTKKIATAFPKISKFFKK